MCVHGCGVELKVPSFFIPLIIQVLFCIFFFLSLILRLTSTSNKDLRQCSVEEENSPDLIKEH